METATKDMPPDDYDDDDDIDGAVMTITELSKLHSSSSPRSPTMCIYRKQYEPCSPDQMQTGPAGAAYVLPCPVAHLSSVSAVVKQPPYLD